MADRSPQWWQDAARSLTRTTAPDWTKDSGGPRVAQSVGDSTFVVVSATQEVVTKRVAAAQEAGSR